MTTWKNHTMDQQFDAQNVILTITASQPYHYAIKTASLPPVSVADIVFDTTDDLDRGFTVATDPQPQPDGTSYITPLLPIIREYAVGFGITDGWNQRITHTIGIKAASAKLAEHAAVGRIRSAYPGCVIDWVSA